VAVLASLATSAAAGDLPRLAQTTGPVPTYEVLTIVRSAKLDPIGYPIRRGPTYVLRAIDDEDREVRVVVDARYGDILAITPVMTASREALRELPPRRYIGLYGPERRAPIIHEADPPLERPRASVPNASLYGPDALRPPGRGPEPPPIIYSDRSSGEGVGAATDGVLPPPPERFPQRAPPGAAQPAPQKRAAAAPPKQAPLPRPRPADAAKVDAAPAPSSNPTPSPEGSPPAAAEEKSAIDQMPH
jgi:hypothetical protein